MPLFSRGEIEGRNEEMIISGPLKVCFRRGMQVISLQLPAYIVAHKLLTAETGFVTVEKLTYIYVYVWM